jgi:flagellar motor switch protein FliG
MLARYKKPGGFKQLLYLVETSTTLKQDQLIKVISSEDVHWAEKIKFMRLTLEKLCTWDAETLEKVVLTVHVRTWLIAIHSLNSDLREDFYKKAVVYMRGAQLKEIEELRKDMKVPLSGEIEAAQIQLLKKVRELQEQEKIQPEKFNPELSMKDLERVA